MNNIWKQTSGVFFMIIHTTSMVMQTVDVSCSAEKNIILHFLRHKLKAYN